MSKKHKRPPHLRKALAAPIISGVRQDPFVQFRLGVSIPFEMLSYKVRCEPIAEVNTDTKEQREFIVVEVRDTYAGIEGQIKINAEKIALAMDLAPLIHDTIRRLRHEIGKVEYLLHRSHRCWTRIKRLRDRRRIGVSKEEDQVSLRFRDEDGGERKPASRIILP